MAVKAITWRYWQHLKDYSYFQIQLPICWVKPKQNIDLHITAKELQEGLADTSGTAPLHSAALMQKQDLHLKRKSYLQPHHRRLKHCAWVSPIHCIRFLMKRLQWPNLSKKQIQSRAQQAQSVWSGIQSFLNRNSAGRLYAIW